MLFPIRLHSSLLDQRSRLAWERSRLTEERREHAREKIIIRRPIISVIFCFACGISHSRAWSLA